MATVNFLIISSQRSGSTLIRTSLDSHPEVHCYGEVFLPTYRKEQSYYEYLTERRASKFAALIRRQALTYDFLGRLYEVNASTAVGFKIMYDQLGYRPYRFPMVLRYARQNKIRILHLIRKNSLNACLSRQFARATRTYHTNETRAQPELNIDVRLLIEEMTKLEQQKSWCRSALNGITALEFCYEDFVQDQSEMSVKLLEFLNVDPGVRLISPLKKVLSAPIRETVTNYDELERSIKEAGYDRFLPE